MRPLKLTMSAFGPYASQEIIDFRELKEFSLFLVTGPTGAGKTTIFDALCFALFGRISGSDRDGENVRSDFADPAILTEVELEFEAGQKIYRIKRLPKQLKPKVRGEGYTEQAATAELTELQGQTLPVCGIQQVNEKVVQILGLDHDQFRQIVMIPQGEFRRLLTEESKEREQILQKIFGTEGFRRIQDRLAEQEKELRDQQKNLSMLLLEAAKRLDLTDHAALQEQLQAEYHHWPDLLVQISDYIAQDQVQEVALQQQLEQQERETAEKSKVLFRAQEAEKKRGQWAQVAEEEKHLLARQEEIRCLDQELEQGRRAAQIRGLGDLWQKVQDKIKQKQTEEQELLAVQQQYRFRLAEAEASLAKARQDAAKRQQLLLQEGRVKEQLERVQELEAKETLWHKTQQAYEKTVADLSENREQQLKLKQASQDMEQQATALAETEKQLIAVQNQFSQHQRLVTELSHWQKAEQELNELRRKYQQQVEQKKRTELAWQKAKVSKEELQGRFILGQAGWLAAKLGQNQPCPVCGSLHHPALAPVAQNLPSEEDLKLAEQVLNQAETTYREQLEELSSAKMAGMKQGDFTKQQKERLQEALGRDLGLSQDEVLWAQQQLSQIDGQLNELKGQVDRKGSLQQQAQVVSQKLLKLEQQALELSNSRLKFHGEVQALEEWIHNFRQGLPQEAQNEAALEQTFKHLQECRRQLDEQLSTAEQNHQDLLVKQSAASASLKACQTQLQETASEAQTTQVEWGQALAQAGFKGEQEFQQALRTPERLQELTLELEHYERSLQQVQQKKTLLKQEIDQLANYDLAAAQAEVQRAEVLRNHLLHEKTQVYARRSRNEDILQHLEKLSKQLNEAEAAYSVLGHLAQVATGKNDEKITFERYVLAAFFDDVITAANLRLRKMTASRYELSRMTEKSKGRAQSGLDLEVYDNYTGRSRPVKTLSGGESFKASLALALGLADVVQAYAGGIRLETMFVDEGFGTLDPESLDSAIDCLLELQQAGRLVGIISHVPDLKERIPARLEIHTGRKGSTTCFIVP